MAVFGPSAASWMDDTRPTQAAREAGGHERRGGGTWGTAAWPCAATSLLVAARTPPQISLKAPAVRKQCCCNTPVSMRLIKGSAQHNEPQFVSPSAQPCGASRADCRPSVHFLSTGVQPEIAPTCQDHAQSRQGEAQHFAKVAAAQQAGLIANAAAVGLSGATDIILCGAFHLGLRNLLLLWVQEPHGCCTCVLS